MSFRDPAWGRRRSPNHWSQPQSSSWLLPFKAAAHTRADSLCSVSRGCCFPGAWSRGPADTLPAPVCGQIRNKFNPLVATTLSLEAKCAPCFGLARYKIIVGRRFHLLVVSGRPSKRRFCYDPVFIGKGSQGGRVLARVEGSKV